MLYLRNRKWLVVLLALLVVAGGFIFSTGERKVDFSAEVKPILNKHCITCHGGVKKQGNFSVLFREEALGKCKSGKYAIVPGDPGRSEMIRRINLKDTEDRMPYHHAPLSASDIETLTLWVKQGAQWGEHWAYVPVKPVAVPRPHARLFGLIPAPKDDWARNDIDYFILEKLREHDLKPSAIADRATLLRRVSLDITGLPPSVSLAAAFLVPNSSMSYETLVDSLLASPHYGEKWTAMWLDLARYADTKGYERDAGRNIWHYRDWLIKAFNRDMPYNRFLVEQLAGDLLPNATDEQLIATAYNRNTMTNDEGGTDNEEFRTAAVLDRVNTVWQGLMGTTFGCVQCHSHPFDPFTHDEFYKFVAFFNDTRDEDTYADYPVLRHFTGKDSADLLSVPSWLEGHGFGTAASDAYRFMKTWQPSINSIQADQFENSELNDTKWLAMRNHGKARLAHVNLDGRNEMIYRFTGYAPGGIWTIHIDSLKGPAVKVIAVPQTKGWQVARTAIPMGRGTHDLYFTYENPQLKKPVDNGLLYDWFYFTRALPGKGLKGYDSVLQHYWNLVTKDVPATPVMMDNPSYMHRATHVFERGNWLVKGKVVTADVPHIFKRLPPQAPRNRLGLAMWLTSKDNPLTARTMVNRLWEQLFGTGLVETLEDMGTQGAEPTHQELLDFLAYQFMNADGWSVKKMIRALVTSATYMQDSKASKEMLEKDAFDKWYERAPRIRLTAEEIRDQALAVSGLLSPKLYGPSVMPWQPEGIWMSPWNGDTWQKSAYEDQYRRAIYTFWKRTAAYPSIVTFDGADREVCTVRRIRTNTPLQALVTLNDSVYLETARYFAYRMLSASQDVPGAIRAGYSMAVLHEISAGKLKVLEQLYEKAYGEFRQDPERTCDMVGEQNEHDNAETAAMVVVANAMLNLDEVVTRN